MGPIIDPEEDFLTILAAEEQISATETKRKKELEDLHSELKGAFYFDFIPVITDS
jgi:kinetochore protein Spc24, fungi type